ncbi:DUF3105 domain-containing protein [Agromyces marinus]|uniref:Membrane protein n=1 Tax=Agromyces marinus TaxID=1389020 RepID=A0ABM8H0B1_9MICO|nr:DUF3105 domain-containing protein [Agromyces marinus]UIP57658.1 hypothetical protein DSM26151_05230 [Agromyces marinus]BDZ54183.1 membrane protein [Agromyces marinus]
MSAPGSKPTIKQQRAAERERKLEEFRKRESRMKRNRLIAIWGSVGAGVVIVGLVAASIVLAPRSPSYTAGGEGAEIEGVATFENSSAHVETPVDYEQTPPAGGEHHPYWLNCGVYEEPVPNEYAVHSQEHGAIWVTYDADALTDDELSTLRSVLPSTYVILSPFDGLPAPIVLSGWNVQLEVDEADDPRIAEFVEEYWQSSDVPEPGASCTGAIDAPGKVS